MFAIIPMQLGKFHLCQNSFAILSHSTADNGGLTYCSSNTVHSASQVSFKMEQTVHFPKRKLNDSDTCIVQNKYIHKDT